MLIDCLVFHFNVKMYFKNIILLLIFYKNKLNQLKTYKYLYFLMLYFIYFFLI